ncbi:unnamed protein product [Blepharisma stoltei]|uniref:Uncharacterized protein n=1 Tax=Blepharisma stoltei TaxID=1481888 RepID=A0AAU9KAG1_9CILI|nr:unnamed protein product [Blepharisma stoltei]
MFSIWGFLVWVGAIKIVYFLLKESYFRIWRKINIDDYKYGWVVITGASDGIGKSLAWRFAEQGFKVILIGRNPEKLKVVSEEIIKRTGNLDVRYIVSDFKNSQDDQEIFYRELIEKLKVFNVSILINNVGVARFSFLSNQEMTEIEEMINTNIYPQTLISYYLIPIFAKRYKELRTKSLVINFSSLIEEYIVPGAAVYSATKQYNHFLSEALSYEYKDFIDFVTVKPGTVATNLLKDVDLQDLPLIVVNVDEFTTNLLKNLHAGINYGHWKHAIISYTLGFVPYQLVTALLQLFMPLIIKLRLIKQ